MTFLTGKNILILGLVGIAVIAGLALVNSSQDQPLPQGFTATDERSCKKLARNYATVASVENATVKQEYTYIRSVFDESGEACIGEYRIYQEMYEAGTVATAYYIHNLKTGELIAQFVQYQQASFDVDLFNRGAREQFFSNYTEKSIELFGSSTITE